MSNNKLSLFDAQQVVQDAIKVAQGQADANMAAVELAEKKGIPLVEAKRIMLAATTLTESQMNEQIAGQLSVVISKGMDRLEQTIEEIPAKNLMATLKGATEIMQVLRGKPSSISETQTKIGNSTNKELRERLSKLTEGAIDLPVEQPKPTNPYDIQGKD